MKNGLIRNWSKIPLIIVCVVAVLFMGYEYGKKSVEIGDSPNESKCDTAYMQDSFLKELNWAQVSQESIKLYDSLNLDGVGNNDDELYVSLYRWCDSDATVIVLQIKLGTGETIAKVIPHDGYYDLYFGHIFSTDKDAVVIQVGVPRSNYGASRLYVYDVYGSDSMDPYPCVIEKFDCAGSSDFTPTIDADILRDDIVMVGTEIVDIEGWSLQGIKLQFDNNNDKWNNIERNIYWTGSGWSTFNGVYWKQEEHFEHVEAAFPEDVSFSGTIFRYGETAYDIAERCPAVTSILSCTPVGHHIIVDGHGGPKNAFYCIFDTETAEFEKDFIGAGLIWQADDIRTAVYCCGADIFDYAGVLLGTCDMDEDDYIRELKFSDGQVQAIVENDTGASKVESFVLSTQK